MKKIGMIGGVGPESTVDYYKFLVSTYRDRVRDDSYPLILINSVDLTKMVRLLNTGDLAGLADTLSVEIEALMKAGAEIGLLSSNTPHIIFDELARRSSIPLISIVKATAKVAATQELQKLGLLGSRYTMHGSFFQEVFARRGMEIFVPTPEEQNWIHEHYMGELVKGMFLPATKDKFLEIVEKLREKHGIEALILGGTELPLLLRDVSSPIPFLDTTRIHVDAVMNRALE